MLFTSWQLLPSFDQDRYIFRMRSLFLFGTLVALQTIKGQEITKESNFEQYQYDLASNLTREMEPLGETQPQDQGVNQIPFSATLPCGACIDGGFIFCKKGLNRDEYDEVLDLNYYNEHIKFNRISVYMCCKNAETCTAIKDQTYTCSNTFGKEKALQKKVCPYVRPICGGEGNHSIELQNTGDFQNITIKGLPQGHTCVYKIHARCGDIVVKNPAKEGSLLEQKEDGNDWDVSGGQANVERQLQSRRGRGILRGTGCEDKQEYFAVTHDSKDHNPDESKKINFQFQVLAETMSATLGHGIKFLFLIVGFYSLFMF